MPATCVDHGGSRPRRRVSLAQIFTIVRELSAPLPSWCTKIGLNEDRLQVETATSMHGDSTSRPEVADVSNLALSTASYLRSLVQNYGASRSALPFVSSSIQVLVSICAKEAILIKETEFVRPRSPNLDRGLNGVVPMLACHIDLSRHSLEESSASSQRQEAISDRTTDENLSPSDPASAESETDQFGSGTSSPTRSGNHWTLAPDVDSESSQSNVGPPSIDAPVDAHVLPGRGRHLSAALPFLCFARSDDIVALMTSAACQRYVRGFLRACDRVFVRRNRRRGETFRIMVRFYDARRPCRLFDRYQLERWSCSRQFQLHRLARFVSLSSACHLVSAIFLSGRHASRLMNSIGGWTTCREAHEVLFLRSCSSFLP
ncbi:hypothetical protein C8R46DRAFT_1084890 [Mycena filopes]|nr:hypothetical protein C8R46DRAFT_1084890 [Mycena filopes]